MSLICMVAASLGGCSKPNMNTEEGTVNAPGIPYSAVIFHRQADTFRSATVNISIVQYGQAPLNDIGNVWSASRESDRGPQKLWINWRSPDTLQIFRNPETHSYKEDKHFDCLTGIFIQTTPFKIEYGDIRDVQTALSAPREVEKKIPQPVKKDKVSSITAKKARSRRP